MSRLDIVIRKGASFDLRFAAIDETGAAINLTGYAARGKVKDYIGGSTLATFEAYVTDALSGYGIAFLSPTVTAALTATRGVYDVELYNVDESDVLRPVEGLVTIASEVTT